MNRRRELLDIEAMVSEANAAMRDEAHAAARFDNRGGRWIAGEWVDEFDIPALSDIPAEDWDR